MPHTRLFDELLAKNGNAPGVESGTNLGVRGMGWAVDDIKKAKRRIRIVTDRGTDQFWGGRVGEAIEEAAGRGVSVEFITGPFFVSPESANDNLKRLCKGGIVQVRHSYLEPELGLRLIDEVRPFFCDIQFEELDGRRYIRCTEPHAELAQAAQDFIPHYAERSVPFDVTKEYTPVHPEVRSYLEEHCHEMVEEGRVHLEKSHP